MPFDESTPPAFGEQVVSPTEMPPATQPAAEAPAPTPVAGVETFAPQTSGGEAPAPVEEHGFTMSAPEAGTQPQPEAAPTPIPVTQVEDAPQHVEVAQVVPAAEASQPVPEAATPAPAEESPAAPAVEAQMASPEEQTAVEEAEATPTPETPESDTSDSAHEEEAAEPSAEAEADAEKGELKEVLETAEDLQKYAEWLRGEVKKMQTENPELTTEQAVMCDHDLRMAAAYEAVAFDWRMRGVNNSKSARESYPEAVA